MPRKYVERGTLRSGGRFAKTNAGYFATLSQLLEAHPKLLEEVSPLSLRYVSVGEADGGSLLQATLRFSTSCQTIGRHLLRTFMRLFREHTEGPHSGFEVLVTFNAVLTNRERNSFSVFYGHDYRADNLAGAAPELRYGEDAIYVSNLSHVGLIPSSFDFERLAVAYRHAFDQSDLRVERFLNVVYLIYRYVPPPATRQKTSKRKFEPVFRPPKKTGGKWRPH